MIRKPQLTTPRAVEIYRDALWFRREFCADSHYFKMTAIWDICQKELHGWTIRKFKSKETEDFKRKAGVAVLGGRVSLTVDGRLWDNAERGCYLSNYILAHEFGHLILEHHVGSAVTKNFQLFSGPNGMSNLPPTLEELEANIAAVFFQCGVALADVSLGAAELARRAFSDYNYVGKAQKYVRTVVFQRELLRQTTKFPRMVF